ncbi:uncharacterized protein BXZ73DRAFT_44744, partial [Epithele typhae]|uniref:uncharacterized protein n=1 Tax=Epithele typhae TaxID=378194 RepID=UPI0020078DAF
TGDRPYKCQHCGDQFARSDLLSRHINKCHASEKPPTTTAPSRRKGTAAASRATTSKQACDQCVTSSLPCDGANPCAKCVHRKCRCTYIKFHRQTAPAGPGHPLPQTMPVARHAISLGAPRLPDEFLLGPAPGVLGVPGMYNTAPHYSLYPNGYQSSLPPLSSALAPSDSQMPPMLHREGLDGADTMARIRAQAELLTRAGGMPNGALSPAQPASSADTSAVWFDLYAVAASAQGGQYDRYNPPSTAQWEAQRVDPSYMARSSGHQSVSFPPGTEPTLQSHPPTANAYPTDNAAYHASSSLANPSAFPSHHTHARTDDLSSDEFGSDAGSSHSIPSSANSSSVHLPLPAFNNIRTREGSKDDYDQQRYPSGAPHDGEGHFSSAFGLMSLDDPNVLAGLAADGQPFFSGMSGTGFTPGANNNYALATPTQDLLAQLKSAGGREGMESKEMRDFWKMYLKTPLTGPNTSGILFPLQTPTGPGSQLGQHPGGSRPSPPRRHSRVASLPSMKTPPLFTDERLGYNGRPSTGDAEAHAQQHQGQAGYNSTMRSTAHGAEDLKSYEQAVLARRAPMTLNIAPKRKGSLAVASPRSAHGLAVAGAALGKSKSMSPVVPHAPFSNSPPSGGGGSKISELLNRPGSSSSAERSGSSGGGGPPNAASMASSSLAHAFTDDPGQAHHSLTEAGLRPSFKRGASQTLGPPNAKRALLNPAGWEEEDEGDDSASPAADEDEDGHPPPPIRMPYLPGSFADPSSRTVGLSAHASG